VTEELQLPTGERSSICRVAAEKDFRFVSEIGLSAKFVSP
jgi:hypothetical protein